MQYFIEILVFLVFIAVVGYLLFRTRNKRSVPSASSGAVGGEKESNEHAQR